ncbi:MAG: hypothetical protein GTO45_12935 [Candidatus Aminicenantes bacterium]|nr:hypothetical protein [Candidatus Aminicenantes bacterium]NIM79690.1 hypothetical protein [Candidatus Aminicenantes bacterium]NIN19016.1 hypothetical protein [Candidatus Aminicenantes bacterium]NIN42918.1 hypothetical protein [Candidatus Aminicenantes bacterium]NIN85655.1 hypothetical protein [Candidatus Aminicenantes bacterium]
MKRKTYPLFGVVLVLWLVCTGVLFSQECGPSCPVCSGGSLGKAMERGRVLATGIFIPWADEETGVLRLRYGIFSWLDAGIGYTLPTEKIIWSLRVQAISEDEEGWRPGILIGTGSVRIGGSDQSLYFQVTKSWELSEGFALQITGGMATLLPDTDRLYGLAGLTVTVTERFSGFVNYDGRSFHPGISWIPIDWLTVSALLVETRDFALSAGIRWKLK